MSDNYRILMVDGTPANLEVITETLFVYKFTSLDSFFVLYRG